MNPEEKSFSYIFVYKQEQYYENYNTNYNLQYEFEEINWNYFHDLSIEKNLTDKTDKILFQRINKTVSTRTCNFQYSFLYIYTQWSQKTYINTISSRYKC